MMSVRLTKLTVDDVLRHLEAQTYDRYYQDIEVLGIRGYVNSDRTWAAIAPLVDWRGKSVADLGCFHGYFSFKVEQAGAASVTGLDHSRALLTTAQMIAALQDSRVTFQLWRGGEPTPDCDVALCLNMLHHCRDPLRTLANMRCRQAVFEIKPEYEPAVQTHFEIRVRRASHRDDRLVLFADKRPQPLERKPNLPTGHENGDSDYMIALLIALLEAYVRESWTRLGGAGEQGRPLRLAVFGAGRHTEWLERMVHALPVQPVVAALLDDHAGAAPVRFGRFAIRPEELDPSTVDAIFLSTDTIGDVLEARCRALFGNGVRILRLYSGFPPGPYPKDYFDSRLQRLN